MQPMRTISLIPVRIKIALEQKEPLYKKLASKIRELKALGMTTKDIAKRFHVSHKTVRKSLYYKPQKRSIIIV